MTLSTPEPSLLTRAHCPVLDCPHVTNARSIGAAVEGLTDHITLRHGSLVKTT